jgi:hypothetical protein
MIFTALINASVFIANLILSVFPSSTGLPAEVNDAVVFLGGYVGILDPIVPLSTLSTVLTLIIGYELTVFGFKGFRWIFSHVPMIGGRG